MHAFPTHTTKSYMLIYTYIYVVLMDAHIGCQALYSVHCYFIMEDCVCGAIL